MNPDLLRYLLLLAVAFGSVLGGISVDRMVVGFPAWRRVGYVAWATYSRKADLGNGLILYPFVAISHTLLSIAVAAGVHGGTSNALHAAAYAAAALALVGLLNTLRAAPFMLSLKGSGDDLRALESAFRGFARWSLPRAIAQALAFGANLWTLSELCS